MRVKPYNTGGQKELLLRTFSPLRPFSFQILYRTYNVEVCMGVKLGFWHWEEIQTEGVWEQSPEENIQTEDK
jgi:hypothetical protein